MRKNGCRAASRVGRGVSIAQLGELFQGVQFDHNGKLHRCLISLPCSDLVSRARFCPSAATTISVSPDYKTKAQRAARFALDLLGGSEVGGRLLVTSDIPEGKGMGSSTADCVATVLSVARAYNRAFSSEQVAEVVVRAETASGNLMFPTAVLFAHREGKVIEQYSGCVPPMMVLGFDTERSRTVETLSFPPAVYGNEDIETFRVLTAALRRAIRTNDVDLLGRVATVSATVNQKFLPKPIFHDICEIVSEVKALGVSVAHSGTVAAILLDPSDELRHRKAEKVRGRLAAIGVDDILEFHT